MKRLSETILDKWAPVLPELDRTFTPRERDVVLCLLEGKDYPETGETLGIEYGTIRAHMDRIRLKLGLSGRLKIMSKYFNQYIKEIKNV